jgi:putative FmdB family regulatory protein
VLTEAETVSGGSLTVPRYQYVCTACGERLEVVQKFTDDALTVCPACQGRLRKVFSAVGVVFKGSGFYRNDSRATVNGTSASDPKVDSSTGSSNGASDAGTDAKKESRSSSSSSATPAATKSPAA